MKTVSMIILAMLLASCSDLGTTGMWGTNGVNNSGGELGTTGIWSTSGSGAAHSQQADAKKDVK